MQDAFLDRRKKNPQYSLRAFARDLGMSHTLLSLIFSGQRSLSPKQAVKVAVALKMSHQDTERLVSGTLGLKTTTKSVVSGGVTSVMTVEIEKFRFMSSWLHFALLEMVPLKTFRYVPSVLAKQFSVTSIEVRTAFERLLNLGLIQEVSKGRYQKLKRQFVLTTDASHASVRAYHEGVMNLVLKELNKTAIQDFKRRYIGAGVVAIRDVDLHRAIEELKEFKSNFLKKYADLDVKREAAQVFQVNVQLFALSQKTGSKNEN